MSAYSKIMDELFGIEKERVEFFEHARINVKKSKEQKEPVYDDLTYIRFIFPDRRDNIIERQATEEDKQKYAKEYAMFCKEQSGEHSGTPLTIFRHAVKPSQVEKAVALGAVTVEAAAKLPDGAADDLRAICLAYISATGKDKTEQPKRRGRPLKVIENDADA